MTIKEEYRRARRNLQKRISRLRSKGYEIAKSVIPKIPKRPTKASIERLKKITRDTLIKGAVYVDRSTGEVLTGRQGEKIEREKSKQKRRETIARKKAPTPTTSEDFSTGSAPNYNDVVISNFRNEIKNNAKPEIANKVMSWLDSMISNYGIARVADMLSKSADAGIQVTYKALYSDADTVVFLEKLISHLGADDDIETAMLEDEIETYFPIDDEFYGNY